MSERLEIEISQSQVSIFHIGSVLYSNSGMRTFQVRSGHLWNSLVTIRMDLCNIQLENLKLV